MVSLRHFAHDVIILSCHVIRRHLSHRLMRNAEWSGKLSGRGGRGGSCVKTLHGYFHAILEVFSNSATFNTTARDIIGNLSASTP